MSISKTFRYDAFKRTQANGYSSNLLQQAEFAIRMLLEFLPADSLEKFSWHPWRPFSADNLKLLYQRQKKMKWLEAIALDQDVNKDLIKSLKLDAAIGNVSRLGLYPDSRDTLVLSNEMLRRLGTKLKKLTLHANFSDAEVEIPVAELQDTPTEPGLVTRTIFSHMIPFESCTPLTLKELTLQNVHVRFAADTYCRTIDFSRLKTLRVFGCLGADSLFAEMCKSRSLPLSLQTFEFKHDDDTNGETISALNTLLTLLSGLRRLYIDIANAKGGPSDVSVIRHAQTLKELLVHSYDGDPSDPDDDEHIWSEESFTKICTSCKEIEQLSVAMPPTPVFRLTEEASRWISAMADMPKLVTLNITTWPTNSPSSSRLPRKAYECLLQSMAHEIFDASVQASTKRRQKAADVASWAIPPTASETETKPSSPPQTTPPSTSLTTIAFGTSDKIYERLDPKTCMVYMRGLLTSPVAPDHPTSAAVPVSWNLRKYEETRSDILDFALARAMRPPCRDNVGGTIGTSSLRGLGGGNGGDDDGGW